MKRGTYVRTQEIREKNRQATKRLMTKERRERHSTILKAKHAVRDRAANWRGGKRLHNGYRTIRYPEHPFSKRNGYVFEHRLIIEKYIGRYLRKDEFVHHINGVKTDNRIENLRIITQSEHAKHHSTKNRKCMLCERKHRARGYCEPHYWTYFLKQHRRNLT